MHWSYVFLALTHGYSHWQLYDDPPCSLSPGPGAYMPKFPLDKKGNMVTTKDGRFKSKPNEVPGPGAYEVRFMLWTFYWHQGPV